VTFLKMESDNECCEISESVGKVKVSDSANCDIKKLKTEMVNFLLGKKTIMESTSTIITDSYHCQLCLSALTSETPKDKVTINDPDIFQCLLLKNEDCDTVLRDINQHGVLFLCRNCLSSFLKLGLLIKQLRKLADEFNQLRLEVGKQIIRKSLGYSEQEGKCWEMEVKTVEGSYPFAVKEETTLDLNFKRKKEPKSLENSLKSDPKLTTVIISINILHISNYKFPIRNIYMVN